MSEAAAPPANGNDWTATLPEEFKPVVTAKGWKEPVDILKSYTNLEKTLGQKRIAAPAQDWKPEQWDSLYKELGRPETPDKYGTPEVKLPDGISIDEKKLAHFKGVFHKAGLLPQQAEQVMKAYFEHIGGLANETTEATNREREAAEFKLRDEWKGDYDLNLKVAKDAVAKFGDEEAVKYLGESGLGNHPAMIKMMVTIGKAMMEDTAKGKGPGQTQITDAATALAEIDKMKKDPEITKKLMDKEFKGKWDALHKAAYPVQAA